MDRKTTLRFGLILVAVAALAAGGGIYLGRKQTANVPVAAAPAVEKEQPKEGEGTAEDGHGEGHEEEGGEHGAEVSDLDRSVEELWAGTCEHDILHYTCDECRYELGAVKLSSELISAKGKPGVVSATKVQTRSFSEAHPLTGEVQLSEGRTIHVTSPLGGVVKRTLAGIGRFVAAGDVLFELDSHDVADAKAEYLKGIAALAHARKTADREATLFAKKISAEVDVQEAEARRTEAEIEATNARSRLLRFGLSAGEVNDLGRPGADPRGLLVVRAPRSGTVLEGHANSGEYVDAGKDLFVVSDLSEVWVWANLREADLAVLARAGGRPVAEVQGPDGRTYRGKVDIVSGTVSEATRTAKARVVLSNPVGSLRPGMFVKVQLLLPGGKNVLAVPKVAVLADEGRPFVFVHVDGDYWVRRPVTLGERSGDVVEIREGLTLGQTIIADGSFLLKSDVLRKKMGAGCAD
ncbi:MAG: efflux RND transporter periplasmic adaptor subunit [Deltaproteobacteria bacterium]|nr:efflux RND transporter periplasmic adaptor subunit [Deltaproteobacteria bacterium]